MDPHRSCRHTACDNDAGDKVYTMRTLTGGYAEYTLASDAFVRHMPNKLSFNEATAIATPFYTAYRALFSKLNIKPGRTVLVHGATGGVGVAAVQMAKAHGCRVIGTAGTPEGLAQLATMTDAAVLHGTATTQEEVIAASEGKGVHYIVEMLANSNLGTDLKMLRSGGGVCVVGSRGDVLITPRDLMRNEAFVVGMTLFAASVEDLAESGSYIEAGITAGTLLPVIGSVHHGLESAAAAHAEVVEHTGGTKGKIVIQLV